MPTPSAVMIAYYNNPTMPADPAEYKLTETAGAVWIGPDGEPWCCARFTDGTFDLQGITPLAETEADPDCVREVLTVLGLK